MKQLKQVFFLALILGIFTVSAFAEVSRFINYQGKLTDKNGVPLEGTYQLTFSIYDQEAAGAGNLLSRELYSSVTVQKGIFNILLGSGQPQASLPLIGNLPFDKPYFLEIKVQDDQPMVPRQRITSAGYALRAQMADNVTSLPRGMIVMWYGSIANIPSGWALCDGNNGTPDLRDRFVVGARQDAQGIAKTSVTGLLTQSGDGSIPAHAHTTKVWAGVQPGASNNYLVGSGTSRSNDVNSDFVSNAVGTGTKNIAVYYALAYIMKL